MRPLRALVAPDKFKGTHTASEVAEAIARGVRDAGGDPVRLPVADGGDGTAAALLEARGGRWVEVESLDPLGRRIDARYAELDDGAAAVDAAEASGMGRLEERELDPLAASSRGTGLLIAAAAEAGAREIIVAPGGSATTDGGLGILEVLAERGLDPRMTVACDVSTPYEEAARVFGPQKGAGPAQVAALEARLRQVVADAPRDPTGVPRTGCGGGISGGLWAHRGAELVPGAELVLREVGFDAALAEADLVITGEGRLDAQTALGKAVGAVAAAARGRGRPCHAIVGRDDLPQAVSRRLGLSSVEPASTLAEIHAAAGRILSAAR